jgi:hypothetical protein
MGESVGKSLEKKRGIRNTAVEFLLYAAGNR